MTLCLKYNGGCSEITPPNCPETLAHQHHRSITRRSRSIFDSSSTFDIFTRSIQIIDNVPECPTFMPNAYFYILPISVTIINVCFLCISLFFYIRRSSIQ